jgi:signal transduction histidine kinase
MEPGHAPRDSDGITPFTGRASTTASARSVGDNWPVTSDPQPQPLTLARQWLTRGVRAALAAPLVAVLSLGLNLPLFIMSVVSLALIPVLGIGFALFPVVTAAVRMAVGLQRRIAPWFGVDIPRPYRVVPAAPYGTWARFRHTVTDPATWLDFAWLLPGAITGFVLGLIAFVVPVYGLEGVLHVPLLLYGIVDWYGYGVFWPMDNPVEAWFAVPQGAVLLTIGLSGAPWLLWLHVRFARFFLAPTRSAELRQRVTRLTETRADAVDTQAAELRRIERDLHDGAQARLVSLSMNIGLAEELLTRDPDAAVRLLAEARESSGAALADLRHLVRGIHPPVLAERGLDGAVRALALTVPATVDLDLHVPVDLPTPVESAAYFVVAEALANVAKHSAATTMWVHMRHTGAALAISVGDDGVGGADPAAGSGLRGIERRLAAFDGTMVVTSPPGGPTVVTMELPCASSSPKTSPSSGTG